MFFHKRLQTFTKLSLRSHTGATRALVPLTTGGGTRPAVLPPGRPAPYHQGPLFFPPGDPHVHASAGPAGQEPCQYKGRARRLGRQAGEWSFRAPAHRPYIDCARTVARNSAVKALPIFGSLRSSGIGRLPNKEGHLGKMWSPPLCIRLNMMRALIISIARYERHRRTKDSRVLLAGPMRPLPPEGCEATTGRISL